MKYLTRYCCLFSCLVLLFVAFCVPVSAEENTKYNLTIGVRDYNNGYGGYYYNVWGYTSGDTFSFKTADIKAYVESDYYLLFSHYIKSLDNGALVDKGDLFSFTYDNIDYGVNMYYDGAYHYVDFQKFDRLQVYVDYTDGTYELIDEEYYNITYDTRLGKHILKFTDYTAKKDIQDIFFTLKYNPTNRMGWAGEYNYNIVWNHNGGAVTVDIQTEEVGLLKSVVEWLKGIKNGITDLFNSITELPAKIWGFIENGLKSLFVPSDDYILTFKQDMSALFEQKLGAVYQVTTLLSDSWDRITDSDTANTIDIPKAMIDLPEGATFSFGGYTVPIVPDRFDFLADACKLISGVVCTWALIGGLRRRYDELMGVEQ